MITQQEHNSTQAIAARVLAQVGIVLTDAEKERIEIADFGLGRIAEQGLQLITYINTERVCAKDLVLTAGQTCPEHRHPSIDGEPGKEETFRCRAGVVYVYLAGAASGESIQASVPAGSEPYYTVFTEHILHPGDQVTILPDTLHWFQGGPDGAVVSEFSTRSRDEFDIFTDPHIGRATIVSE